MPARDDRNDFDPDLLRAIPPDARVVVELGCGTGALAEQYRRINPGVRYVGVEEDAAAAQLAANRLDRVVAGDVDSLEPSALDVVPGSVDCLILANVLETLVDPWAVLGRLAGWVRDGGQVVASIANVQHWAVIEDLLRGRWDYRDRGPLDRTHLRFFTLESIEGLFAGAGLHVFGIRPRLHPVPEHDRFRQLMVPVVGALGLDAEQFAIRTRYDRYTVRAVRAPAPPRLLLVRSWIGEPLACGRVRIQEPDAFLGTIPGVRALSSVDPPQLGGAQAGAGNVFIQQRILLPPAAQVEVQRTLMRSGTLIVAELDDEPTIFPQFVRHEGFSLRSCHCVQTSTDALADALRRYNPHVKVFANQMASLPPLRPRPDDGPVTVFFGALNRERDWAPIMPGLNRILDAHGDRVRVRVVHDLAFFNALRTDRKEFEPFCAYGRYQELLQAADVALLPLNPSPFNAAKSDLKFLECAAHGVVALASPTVYGATIRHGETGLIAHSAEEFESLLAQLVADAPLRRRLAAGAYQYVAGHRLLGQHYRERYDWYVQMLDRKPELDRDLRSRVPELFSG